MSEPYSQTPDFESSSVNQLTPALYLVSTPIGNLRDITLRALDVLKGADWIAAEDTRVSQRILETYAIKTRLRSCHDHNEERIAMDVVADIRSGQVVAFVSDAGTPLISDPGYRLVQACIDNNLPVIPVPGANAVLPALQLSGLPAHEFYFAGFLPPKQGARRRRLESLQAINATLIFYEAPHRLADMLASAAEVFGARRAAVAREITKKFEEVVRAPLPELAVKYQQADSAPRGEIVVVIEGAPPEEKWDEDRIIEALDYVFQHGSPFREAVALITAQSGWPKRDVYNLATKLRSNV